MKNIFACTKELFSGTLKSLQFEWKIHLMMFGIFMPELSSCIEQSLFAFVRIEASFLGIGVSHRDKEFFACPESCEVGTSHLQCHLAEIHTIDVDHREVILAIVGALP